MSCGQCSVYGYQADARTSSLSHANPNLYPGWMYCITLFLAAGALPFLYVLIAKFALYLDSRNFSRFLASYRYNTKC